MLNTMKTFANTVLMALVLVGPMVAQADPVTTEPVTTEPAPQPEPGDDGREEIQTDMCRLLGICVN
ncbi:MAG TPA: hypothetical protein DCS87_01570 [Rheinheimera sp.]|nr:hypothetical protein [Rheinheimera sp.]